MKKASEVAKDIIQYEGDTLIRTAWHRRGDRSLANSADDLCRAIESAITAARREAFEEAAKVCDGRFTGDLNREDMEARRCAEAIRALAEREREGE